MATRPPPSPEEVARPVRNLSGQRAEASLNGSGIARPLRPGFLNGLPRARSGSRGFALRLCPLPRRLAPEEAEDFVLVLRRCSCALEKRPDGALETVGGRHGGRATGCHLRHGAGWPAWSRTRGEAQRPARLQGRAAVGRWRNAAGTPCAGRGAWVAPSEWFLG